MPNNREFASAFWLIVLAIWALSQPDVRTTVADVLKVARGPKISIPFLLLSGNLVGLCLTGAWLGAWDEELVTGTGIWLVVSGGVTFVSLNDASRDRQFFRHLVLATLQFSVGVEFLLSLFVLNLPLELILQPTLGTLAVLSVAAAREERYARVRGIVDGTLGIIGLAFVGYAVFQFATSWETFDLRDLARTFALPIWLTVGTIPLFYAMSLYMTYELAFGKLRLHVGDGSISLGVRLAVLLRFNVRLRELGRMHGAWWSQVARAQSFREAWRATGEFDLHGDDIEGSRS